MPTVTTTAVPRTVLLADDDPALRALIRAWLEPLQVSVRDYSQGEEVLAALSTVAPLAVLLDLNMPGMGGLATLKEIRTRYRYLPVVVFTSEREVQTVVEVMQQGAYDFLPKPLAQNKLLTTVRNAIAQHEMTLRVLELEAETGRAASTALVGDSTPIRELHRHIHKLAATDISVYIHGESGSGKELVARAIHAAGARAQGPFVALNCAAITESLQESELFGHERGSFTGATGRHVGKFEQAQGGTLFLDEVAELSLAVQAKLLRVLQEHRFVRVGGREEVRSDFRLLAATHRRLLEEVQAGRFREDLYFRIVVFELEVPPLRDRGHDILLLARHFLKKYSAVGAKEPVLAPAARELLESYAWPGNVRELENAMQRALVSAQGAEVLPTDLPPALRTPVSRALGPSASPEVLARLGAASSLVAMEREAIAGALARCAGNRSRAAAQLGIGRTTLYRKMREYGLLSR